MARTSGAGRPTPVELRREIEAAQRRLTATVDELAERASPRGIAKRGLRDLRGAGEALLEEARAVATGAQTVRRNSEVVEPPQGSVLLKGDDEVVSTYEPRALPPGAIVVGVGVGVVAAAGVVIWLRRRRRRI
ncbi:DUF3618 domain-containing protein [Spiractinospora alimapuensis]|uniref:DUF3618 domain-containing protein n=1 Tax=Spiractinospora alimapuensis TaxID=2820884 RepID=UPI001F3ABB0A|nr:DUF3618 domain-containing protein [Spiractinospora alimapuensis]QVQ54139.1 DUF3618 domain-containing protein [Spiractinospora alimapuensis]